ncbi:type I methionyl aminopeptidase [Desulfoluna spongiiphila]|uniref:type I methionyl aminopeptidase n=1 Tax=Desulfoluna spongiiphila TaxID=419481 RepID=UPI001253BF8D|nr:type I methionyl aminopeptidase [Desulfoluna spongiiphila]VVS91380.1 peptidase m24 [Desulfoluna spongiiphila]
MTIETDNDLRELKKVGRAVALTLKEMISSAEPGMTTRELDLIGKSLLESYGAKSAPKVSYDFPGYTCISINEEVAHGIPGDRIIKPGDVVNIDVSAEKNGYFADTGGTFIVPPGDLLKKRLISSARIALSEACHSAKAGKPLNSIGKAIQKVAKRKNFKIIRNLCGHGVGRGLHENPKEIPGYYEPNDKRILHEGLVIAIEPFLSTKSNFVSEGNDGWTLIGSKGNFSAQFEHTIVITNGKPIILTVA